MASFMRVLLRWLRRVLLLLFVLVAGLVGLGWWTMRGSLALLEGTGSVKGLGTTVTIERDERGVPTIRAASLPDLARAIGFLHGQDRFFQMDLLRRRAAGELAELVGANALPLDRGARLHRFRALAEEVLRTQLDDSERALLQAYADGANAGLTALRARPWEYFLLRSAPRPWAPVDTILTGYAMTLDLQDGAARRDRTRLLAEEVLGADVAEFFDPRFTPEDAAIDGSTGPLPPLPGPERLEVRKLTAAAAPVSIEFESEPLPGSNNFALSGRRTAHGGALVADDMHLGLAVPNIWYRASFVLPDRTVTGATLPGTPAMIVGSNGHVAWGFTNSYTRNARLTRVTPGTAIEEAREILHVKGAADEILVIRRTKDGVILPGDKRRPELALDWNAHQAAFANVHLLRLMSAKDAGEAIRLFQGAGIPAQNVLIGDSAGRIAWTLSGRMDLPVPPVYEADALWTANNRVVGGESFQMIGEAGFEGPARAAQIRDDLAAITHPATPRDLLAVQLDDRALFLARWRDLLLGLLTPERCANHPDRSELRSFVENWGGRAAPESVGYRVVREFRRTTSERVLAPIVAALKARDENALGNRLRSESAIWEILRQRPAHFLPAAFQTWDDLLLGAADEILKVSVPKSGRPLPEFTFGEINRARIRHPFSSLLPAWAATFLDLPSDPLPGDHQMPRVQAPNFGASQRMVVAPGREQEGIFHLPGGQSGHPLSPFYRAGHEDWVKGNPSAFLPGPTLHRLELNP